MPKSFVQKIISKGRTYHYLRVDGLPRVPLGSNTEQAEALALEYVRSGVPAKPDQRKRMEQYARRMMRNIRVRAERKGMACEVTSADILMMLAHQNHSCSISGLPFDLDANFDTAFRRPFAPSLDRIDSSKGYLRENCRLVCVIANYAMGQWGEEVFGRFASAYVGNKRRRKEIGGPVKPLMHIVK